MICRKCLISKQLSLCSGRYVIGQIPDEDTAVKIRIKNMATGRIEYIKAVSDSDGKVEIEYQPMRHQYEIQVINSDGQPYTFTTTEMIETECINVFFEINHNTNISE